MRSVVQRVTEASVTIDDKTRAVIGKGLVVLLGIEDADCQEDVVWLAGKIIQLRIFNDENGFMNLSVRDVGGDVLVVSQFTLHASVKKGNRPSFNRASKPDKAIPLYEAFIREMERQLGKSIQTGEFGARMKVSLVNQGPVTIFIDTKE